MGYELVTDEDRAELDRLTTAVKDALAARAAFLDKRVPEIADVKVGELLYDLESGLPVGEVVSINRWNRGTVDDDGFGYFYRYRDGGIDNTARQHGKSFGSKDQALQRAETRLRILRVA